MRPVSFWLHSERCTYERTGTVSITEEYAIVTLDQCFPTFFARGPLLFSINNHGFSHPYSCKFRVFGW